MDRHAIAEDLSMEAAAQMPNNPLVAEFWRFLTAGRECDDIPVPASVTGAYG